MDLDIPIVIVYNWYHLNLKKKKLKLGYVQKLSQNRVTVPLDHTYNMRKKVTSNRNVYCMFLAE